MEAPGTWCDYGMFFAWSDDLKALHFSCALDMRVQSKLMGQVYELLAKLNERLWMGHFAIWVEEGIPMFRHTVRLPDRLDSELIGELMDLAVCRMRTLLPRLPVRHLGRPHRRRRDRKFPARYGRRSLSAASAFRIHPAKAKSAL